MDGNGTVLTTEQQLNANIEACNAEYTVVLGGATIVLLSTKALHLFFKRLGQPRLVSESIVNSILPFLSCSNPIVIILFFIIVSSHIMQFSHHPSSLIDNLTMMKFAISQLQHICYALKNDLPSKQELANHENFTKSKVW